MLLSPFMTFDHLFLHHIPMLFQFRETLFVDETTGQKAFFTHQSDVALVPAQNYGKQLPGLWIGGGASNTIYKYQLLICNADFLSGFFISGYTNCFKGCAHWCGNLETPYFRSPSSSSSYAGVAFNENGHATVTNKLISVGIRWEEMKTCQQPNRLSTDSINYPHLANELFPRPQQNWKMRRITYRRKQ